MTLSLARQNDTGSRATALFDLRVLGYEDEVRESHVL